MRKASNGNVSFSNARGSNLHGGSMSQSSNFLSQYTSKLDSQNLDHFATFTKLLEIWVKPTTTKKFIQQKVLMALIIVYWLDLTSLKPFFSHSCISEVVIVFFLSQAKGHHMPASKKRLLNISKNKESTSSTCFFLPAGGGKRVGCPETCSYVSRPSFSPFHR